MILYRGFVYKTICDNYVYGKDIANTCSICGGHGTRENGLFVCNDCGIVIDEKTNTAKNTLERGLKTK